MIPLRILTVDDEVLALRRLKLLLQKIPNAEHVGEASGCAEALAKIAMLRPDVVLLDIRMRDGSGFDVIDALQDHLQPPVVLFVTAFDEFAVRAFDTAVVDYLLKPVEKERLARALDRARQRAASLDAEQRADELQQVVRQLRSARHEGREEAYESEFWLRGAGGLVRVHVDAIDCVSSEDEYVGLHTATGTHLMRSSLRQFADRVEPRLFVRVHRAWLVKESAIAELRTRGADGPEVILRNGKRLPTGRVYLKHLRSIVHLPAKRFGRNVPRASTPPAKAGGARL